MSLLYLEQNFNRQQYEDFHASWEVLYRYWLWTYEDVLIILYRLLFPGPIKLTQMYRVDPCGATHNRDITIDLSPKRVEILRWPEHFPHKLPKLKTSDKTNNKPTPADIDLTTADTDKLTTDEQTALAQFKLVPPSCSKADLAESVIMPLEKNNPGFDIALLENANHGMYCNCYVAGLISVFRTSQRYMR